MEFANSIGNWDKLSQIHYGIRSLVEHNPFHLLPPIYRWLKRHAKLFYHASVQYLYIAANIKEYLTIISIAIYRFVHLSTCGSPSESIDFDLYGDCLAPGERFFVQFDCLNMQRCMKYSQWSFC